MDFAWLTLVGLGDAAAQTVPIKLGLFREFGCLLQAVTDQALVARSQTLQLTVNLVNCHLGVYATSCLHAF